jgi:ketosteroid isomerase-like protein
MTPASSRTTAARFVDAFAAGWRLGERDAFLAHFEPLLCDDVRMEQPLAPVAIGIPQFRAQFSQLFALIPDLTGEVDNWGERDDVVFIELTLTGKLGRRPFGWTACDRIVLRDGAIAERRSFFDPRAFGRAVATRPSVWPRAIKARR